MDGNLSDFLNSIVPEELAGADADVIIIAIIMIILGGILIVAFWVGALIVSLKINKTVFRKLEKKKGSSITLQFLQKVISLVCVLVFIVIPLGGKRFAESLLGSTAVLAAVIGLAAGDVIKDMFAGLEISIYKPFDVGSRIMLEDGTAGIVEKLTLRHTVLKLIDTTRLVVPNSRANSAIIKNFSYEESVPRSMELQFPIAYNADVDKAKEVIRRTICTCPLTLNRDTYHDNTPNSRSVYFLELKDSSLIMGATVYYPHEIRTEVVKDEINTRVFKALALNGIEIPYNYVNVVMREQDGGKKNAGTEVPAVDTAAAPAAPPFTF